MELKNLLVSQGLHFTSQKPNEVWKTVRLPKSSKTTIAIRFNVLQILSTRASFVFNLLFIPSFHILGSYFYVSLSYGGISHCFNFDKFCDTAPLKSFTFKLKTNWVLPLWHSNRWLLCLAFAQGSEWTSP